MRACAYVNCACVFLCEYDMNMCMNMYINEYRDEHVDVNMRQRENMCVYLRICMRV